MSYYCIRRTTIAVITNEIAYIACAEFGIFSLNEFLFDQFSGMGVGLDSGQPPPPFFDNKRNGAHVRYWDRKLPLEGHKSTHRPQGIKVASSPGQKSHLQERIVKKIVAYHELHSRKNCWQVSGNCVAEVCVYIFICICTSINTSVHIYQNI